MPIASNPRVLFQHQLKKRRKSGRRRPVLRKPELCIPQILAWADDFHNRSGSWPKVLSGRVASSSDETWLAVNHALVSGLRGLPGGSSLARLLADKRGVRNKQNLPRLNTRRILKWADWHKREKGKKVTTRFIKS